MGARAEAGSSIRPFLISGEDDPSGRLWIERTHRAVTADATDMHTELAQSMTVELAELEEHLQRCVVSRVDGPNVGELPAGVEVVLSVDDHGPEVTLCLSADSARIVPDARDRFFEHVAQVLSGLGSREGGPLSGFAVLSGRESALLEEWNRTSVQFDAGLTLVGLFERRVAVASEAVALVCGGVEVSYGELSVRANRLAGWLVGVGVGSEVLVGVLMERSVEMVVALYAVLKAGGGYVPLDPDVPGERLAFMVEEAGLGVVLTQEALVGLVPGGVGAVLCVDSEWGVVEGFSGEDLGVVIDAGSAAYVIYTSGSTGRPKGVVNTHGGIVNRLLWMQSEYGLGSGDCVLQKTPFSFDVSVWEFFWPLQVGARLVVAEPGGHRDSGYLAGVINEQLVSTVHFVPSMLRLFLDDVRAGSCESLRRVVCSGEALTFDLQERFFEVFPVGVDPFWLTSGV